MLDPSNQGITTATVRDRRTRRALDALLEGNEPNIAASPALRRIIEAVADGDDPPFCSTDKTVRRAIEQIKYN